ncbi:MAG: hypothetical protein IT327_08460 [Anaerolineae bacterium]|nr:hypothetical protein [Anaerolineae bacterium]
MGKRNYLIEGVSGTGKTSVCHELRRRGYAALNSDRDLRQHTDPTTGERLITFSSPELRHAANLWDVAKVRRLAANQDDEVTFFCGGSRNFPEFFSQAGLTNAYQNVSPTCIGGLLVCFNGL